MTTKIHQDLLLFAHYLCMICTQLAFSCLVGTSWKEYVNLRQTEHNHRQLGASEKVLGWWMKPIAKERKRFPFDQVRRYINPCHIHLINRLCSLQTLIRALQLNDLICTPGEQKLSSRQTVSLDSQCSLNVWQDVFSLLSLKCTGRKKWKIKSHKHRRKGRIKKSLQKKECQVLKCSPRSCSKTRDCRDLCSMAALSLTVWHLSLTTFLTTNSTVHQHATSSLLSEMVLKTKKSKMPYLEESNWTRMRLLWNRTIEKKPLPRYK